MTTRNILLSGFLALFAFTASAEQTLDIESSSVDSALISLNNSEPPSLAATNFSPSESRNKSSFGNRQLTTGLYPLVEGTGYLSQQYTLQMAWNQISYSLMDGVTIGTQPALFLFRTPNFFVKTRLYEDKTQSVALNIGTNILLKNSGEFFTTFYASSIHNPNSSVYVVPVTLAHSYKLNSFITIHQTLSDINVYAEKDIKNEATIGYAGILELKARNNHSVFIHASEVGFLSHDYYYAGLSYRYSTKRFFTQVGYFYRVQTEGVQVLPLFDIGFTL